MRLFLKGCTRLIKSDVSVFPDSQKLHIHTTGPAYNRIVLCTGFVTVLFQSIRHKGLVFIDVYMVKQIFIHKVSVTLLIIPGNPFILIQIYSRHLRKIQISLFVPFHQLCIHSHRSGTGCKTQHCIWLHNDLCRHDIGCLSAYILIIFSFVNNHKFPPQILFFDRYSQKRLPNLHYFCLLTEIITQLSVFYSNNCDPTVIPTVAENPVDDCLLCDRQYASLNAHAL